MPNEGQLRALERGVEEWNKWRKQHPGVAPDLSDANLNGFDLSGAHLNGADLSGATIAGAFLRDTDLRNACLHGANLRFSYLLGINLIGTDLSNADLEHATLSGVIFVDVALHEVKGLESVRHLGPSEISFSTIYRSEGKIPEVFLRGCGVPQEFLTYVPSLTRKAMEYYSCFISYSHTNKSFAHRLHDALQGRGIRCWLDEHQLLPGHDVLDEVDRGIRRWDKVLLCCSEASLTSWWVDDEITKAYEKEQALMRKRRKKVLVLVPLNLDGYLFSGEWKSGKAPQVRSRLAADFTGWKKSPKKFAEQFERVVKALRIDGGRELPPKPKL